jgi:hypothetical protein
MATTIATRTLSDRKTTYDDRRRQPRYTLNVPAALRWDGGVLDGYTVNLSYFGALIQAKQPLPLETEVDLVLTLEAGRAFMRGRVARVESDATRFAIEFTDVLRNGPALTAALVKADDLRG